MTQTEFNRTVRSFDVGESMRAALYYRARDLIADGFAVEAHILILSTWNFARFRYAMRTFNLSAYENTLKGLGKKLARFGDDALMDINLDEHREAIETAFDELAGIKGIEFTGAAKMLHLLKPSLFVMWDRAIMGWYTPRRDYARLGVVTSGFWENRRFARRGAGYHEFLACCQDKFRGFASPDQRKTLAKCIDEFLFCTITMQLATKRKREPET